ncbi:MAG: AAA family ATPase [Magnetococcales bacterium]|nr:AAA family ATPase [Magnetococcales bacterium]MBF0262756.1 AAA family ATPase [Magnetococcales bacterium]
MIIRRLQSENILRFKKLDLDDLPASGPILITGPDEAGKSALLEILCLALFGRSANLADEAVAKAVRWGAEQGSIQLDFTVDGQTGYTLIRHFDNQGGQDALLKRTGEETPLAHGAESVDSMLATLLGFGFETYIDTLYLTQGRHAHHARGLGTVKMLAGVTTLESLATTLTQERMAIGQKIETRVRRQDELKNEITGLNLVEETLGQLENRLKAARNRVAVAVAAIERWLGFDAGVVQAGRRIEAACNRMIQTSPNIGMASWTSRCQQLDNSLKEIESICQGGHLSEVEVPAGQVRQWHAKSRARLDSLGGILATVVSEQNRLASWLGEPTSHPSEAPTLAHENAELAQARNNASRTRTHRGWGVMLFLMLSLVGGIFTALAWQVTHHPGFAPGVNALLTRLLPAWPLSPMLLGVPTVLFMLLMFWNLIGRFTAGSRIHALSQVGQTVESRAAQARQTLETLRDAANRPVKEQVDILLGMEGTPWSDALKGWSKADGQPFLDAEVLEQELCDLGERLKLFQAEHALLREKSQARVRMAKEEHAAHLAAVATLESEVENEKVRRREHARLLAAVASFENENLRDRRAIEVRRSAESLLSGCATQLKSDFLHEANRLVARGAPLFTGGRYHQPRLDGDLNLAIFSVAKNDFMHMEELSTGVRRQLTLALRLALCQALAARTQALHFLALDEPFAYFDRERARASLAALIHFSDSLPQLWITAETFDDDQTTSACLVACSVDGDTLTLTARSGP